MFKMMKEKLDFKLKPLDLHGISHSEVTKRLENYVFQSDHQKYFPIKIITGNSDKMKNIVIRFLKSHKYKYYIGDKYNKGYVVVTK